MEPITFGKRLTEVRKLRKLSQDELGKKVEVHGAVIGRYERDEVKPSIEMAKSMAEVLEASCRAQPAAQWPPDAATIRGRGAQ